MTIDLSRLPLETPATSLRNDVLLFSESAGRFIVTVDPRDRDGFESHFDGLPCACVGEITPEKDLVVASGNGDKLISVPVSDLKQAWKTPFGDLI